MSVNLDICVNVDGLPISKSSGNQVWPIMVNLMRNKNVVDICGIYQGNEKPNSANEFMADFVNEAIELITNGFVYNKIRYSVKIVCFICDVPAKSFIKCTVGHTGYNSCSKCNIKGTYIAHRTCFPALDRFCLRTDDTFRTKKQKNHHNETSILENIPGLDMINSFPLDYMHLICLGVMKKLLNLWISGKPTHRLPSQQINNMSAKYLEFKKQIPAEFSRKPRSLSEVKRWKATEFRIFLFYTGPLLLLDLKVGDLENRIWQL
uniref:Uncharacterized protein LOC114347306 n=1 Tax=Diabrotica virgifera virgifera TaxID=50390 RepID=A0A6P7GVQ8_DIAVI